MSEPMEIDSAASAAADLSPAGTAVDIGGGDASPGAGQKSNAEDAGNEEQVTTMTVLDMCDYFSENSDEGDDSDGDGASYQLGDDGDDGKDDEYPTGKELLDVYSLDILMKHYIGDGSDDDDDDESYQYKEDEDDDEMEEEKEKDSIAEGEDNMEEDAEVHVAAPNEEEKGEDVALPADFAVLSSHLIELSDLQECLDEAAKEGRLRRYLTTVHDEDDEAYAESGMSIVDFREADGIPEEGPLRCRVNKILHGTPLHYACSDANGSRGEAKIRLILNAASRLRIDPAELMTASMLVYEYDDDEEGLVLNEEPMAGGTTPLWMLINNRSSSCHSVATLCEYWPHAAFLRNELGETTLLRLLRNGAEPERYRQNPSGGPAWHGKYYWCKDFGSSAIATLLEAAARARHGGAGTLVAATDGSDRMDMRRGDGCSEYGRGPTVLDVVCSHLDALDQPEGLVWSVIHYCPDLLLLCNADDAIHPFHRLVRLMVDDDSNEDGTTAETSPELCDTHTKLQCALALFEKSSTMAIASSLTRVDWDEHTEPSSGFRLLKDCLFVQSSDSAVMDVTTKIDTLLSEMILSRDARGRSLLHYLAAWDTSIIGYELSKIQSDIVASRSFSRNKERDLSDEEITLMETDIAESECRNTKDFVDAFSWLCELEPRTKTTDLLDDNGLNPLQYALTKGKTWDDGMCNLVRLFPNWNVERADGLYPYQLTDDLTTSFELLRCAPGVVARATKGAQ